MSQQEDFPSYDSYGVPAVGTSVSYFHLEEISDIALEYDWDFKPHVHTQLYQMIWVEKGKGTFSSEGKTVNFDGNWVVFIVPNTLHSISFEKNTVGRSLYFTHDFMNVGYLGNMLQNFMGNVSIPMCQYTNISADKRKLWGELFENLKQEFNDPNALGYNASMKAWLSLLLTQLVRMENTQCTMSDNHDSMRSEQLVNVFFTLLEKNYKEERRVDFYANEMGVSVDTLGNHIRAVMKRTVGKVIRERIVLEAKRLLVYSDKTIGQVADALNFEDDSYFIRFFKRETGMTPSKYKKQEVFLISQSKE